MRKIIITPEMMTAICGAIIDSPKNFDIATRAGVSVDTYKVWVKEGKELAVKHEEAGTKPDDEHERNLIELHNKSRFAHRQFRQRQISKIEVAANDPKHWGAAKYLLERYYPEDFAPQPEDIERDKSMMPTIIINTARNITSETMQSKHIQVNVITPQELEDKRVKVQNVEDEMEKIEAELVEDVSESL